MAARPFLRKSPTKAGLPGTSVPIIDATDGNRAIDSQRRFVAPQQLPL